MKVATWNVNGIRARHAQLVEWVARDRPDVICLQEIKAAPEQIAEALTGLPDYWSYWHGAKGGYSGVSLHLRKAAFTETPRFSHPPFDAETRIVQAHVGTLTVASVYMPNGGKDYPAKLAFYGAMEGYVADALAGGGDVIVCGDLNVARTDDDVHPSQRKPNIIGQRPEERALLERMIAPQLVGQGAGGRLVDVARALEPDNTRLFTWWPYWRAARERNLGWRLDYVLVSEALSKRAQACVVRTEIGTSDHAPVLATFGEG